MTVYYSATFENRKTGEETVVACSAQQHYVASYLDTVHSDITAKYPKLSPDNTNKLVSKINKQLAWWNTDELMLDSVS